MRIVAYLVGLEPTPGSAKKAPRSGALAALPPLLSGRRSRGLSRGLEFLGAKDMAQNALDSVCGYGSREETTRAKP